MDMIREYKLRIKNVDKSIESLVILTLESSEGGKLPPFEPGAHLEIELISSWRGHYSLCSYPTDPSTYRIAILRERYGRGGSKFLYRHCEVGKSLTVRGPFNNFKLDPNQRGYLFIAGGIGITPLLPMIQDAQNRGKPWRLVYGGRSLQSMAFLDELTSIGDQIDLWPQDQRGVIDIDKAVLPLIEQGYAGVYCCGPDGMLTAVQKRVSERFPSCKVNFELFKARKQQFRENQEFKVRLARSGNEVIVHKNETIAEALGKAGISTLLSCKEGVCGTCLTTVISGTPEHRDSYLNPDDQAAGEKIMICCSRSLDSNLELDL